MDYYVGEPVNKNMFCMATNMSLDKDKRNDLSENSEEYWVHNCIFGSSVRIRKSSSLGNDITNLINSKSNPSKIYKAVDLELLKNHISINKIYSQIENLKKEFTERGKKQKEQEIKKVLGIW